MNANKTLAQVVGIVVLMVAILAAAWMWLPTAAFMFIALSMLGGAAKAAAEDSVRQAGR